MSEKITRQANAYRLRAEEVRTVADATRDQGCREALMRIADGYVRLAKNLDQVALKSGPAEHPDTIHNAG